MSRRPSQRGGLPDLLLVALVVAACFTRTPVGGLMDRASRALFDRPGRAPALTSYFLTGPPAERLQGLDVATLSPTPPAPDGGFPEPYRTAAATLLGPEVLDALDASESDDPILTLELRALGAEQRSRAIRRARAAGDAQPDSLESYRRYLPAELARRAEAEVALPLALASLLELQWPVRIEHRISSPYGYRFHPVLKRQKLHNGTDIAVPIGTPVHAAQGGSVAAAREDDLNGRYVVIDHGHGLRTSYCHLDRLDVTPGQALQGGDALGLSGNTGRSTGPHLHFTVRVGTSTVDPEDFRRGDGVAEG